tara:strand:+ start:206 stop:898 length:693 start_codon:yes stop_codon:yes gene_type:complete
MENFDKIFKEIQVTDNSSITFTIFCLLLTLFCSYVLKYTFEKKSNSLSSKYQISNMMPILAGTTFLVILIVKSSLALSLGLVGALSIVRFRTPIKEPEDLVYLFLSIGLGIGFGAYQVLSTLIIFFIIIIFIWLKKSNFDDIQSDYNFDILFKNNDMYQKNIDEINNILKKNTESINFIKQENHENKNINLSLKLKFKKYNQIKLLTSDLDKINKENDILFSIYESKILF